MWRDGEGTLDLVEVLCHLADGEITDWMPRVERILSRRRPVHAVRSRGRLHALPRLDGRRRWSASSASCAARTWRSSIVSTLSAPHLRLTGEHPEFGPVTLQQLLALLGHARHGARRADLTPADARVRPARRSVDASISACCRDDSEVMQKRSRTTPRVCSSLVGRDRSVRDARAPRRSRIGALIAGLRAAGSALDAGAGTLVDRADRGASRGRRDRHRLSLPDDPRGARGCRSRPFDQDAWAPRAALRRARRRRVARAVRRAARVAAAAACAASSDEKLDRFGMHAERGKESVAAI